MVARFAIEFYKLNFFLVLESFYRKDNVLHYTCFKLR